MTPASKDNVLLRADKIRKTFHRDGAPMEILKGVSIQIQKGERLAIMGPSGAGKSTLLHILGTLEKPSQGKVLYGDKNPKDLFGLNDAEISAFRNRAMGFVFQFHHLLPELSAVENISLPARIAGWSPREADKRSGDLLKWIGLDKRRNHRPQELSGGERQRIAVARAVMLQPSIIMADEPTGNLDSKNRDVILDLLQSLSESQGIALVLVTHDPVVSQRMNRVMHLQDGQWLS